MRCLIPLTLCVAVLFLFSGCEPGKSGSSAVTPNTSSKTGSGTAHTHADGSVHEDHGTEPAAAVGAAADAHGKVHNGHPISFGDAGFSAEWNHHSENDIIDIYIVNQEGTADLPIQAASITVRQATGDAPESFELTAVEPNADGESAHFQRDDNRLNTAMALGVVVEVEFKGEKKTATIAPHKAHDH